MNIIEKKILLEIHKNPYKNQRTLAKSLGYSLGSINQSIKHLLQMGYLDSRFSLTVKAISVLRKTSPQNAIILAAGYDFRMYPTNMDTPKALLEIKNIPLIERIIHQLHSVNIHEIYIVVGYLKEKFDYLIDKYDVHLIYNSFYAQKNNIYSLKLAETHLSNSYIIPCDIWCKCNPFNTAEMYSWYMVNDKVDITSTIHINRKEELVCRCKTLSGNGMLGISFLLEEDIQQIKPILHQMCETPSFNSAFWEEALFTSNSPTIYAKLVSPNEFIEINTYEQIQDLNETYQQLHQNAILSISKAFCCNEHEITNIEILKKGMTNHSVLFELRGQKFILRIPGEGTTQLINRKNEANVYSKIQNRGICDKIAYIDSETGYKVSHYIENARVCNPKNDFDLQQCMHKLHTLHDANISVEHEFDIFEQISFYENLWGNFSSIYKDYAKTKEQVFSLKHYIDKYVTQKCLTHIDAIPDNFLFTETGELYLIDWEYAGMQDPHVDIAMFCIYACYNRQEVDHLIDLYFENSCANTIRIKIYCYISACGLLWSNWCEFKRNLGIEFGEYSLQQYRYAKEYFKIAKNEIEKEGLNNALS